MTCVEQLLLYTTKNSRLHIV